MDNTMTKTQYEQLEANGFTANQDGVESDSFAAACCENSIEELYNFDNNKIYAPDQGDRDSWYTSEIGVTDIRNAIEWQMYWYD